MNINKLTPEDLKTDIQKNVAAALEEDIGTGDITAELIPPDAQCNAHIMTREACVVCGCAWVDEVFKQLGGTVQLQWQVEDGDLVEPDMVLLRLHGNARALLSGERTALNFLQLLSGTATTARTFAQKVQGTNLKILDTRKTLPGLRMAQKYAVGVGGCHNHRLGLFDAFLIKENHITACGGIRNAIERAQRLHSDKPIIVEVETYDEYCQAIQYPLTRIMLDSLNPADLEKVYAHPTTIPLETSGNVEAAHLQAVAATAVQAVSSGALTKNVTAIDLSMRVFLEAESMG